jgi:hypothetical protein
MTCERYDFFKNRLGWVGTEPSLDLEFGVAFHLGKEHLRLHNYAESALDGAIDAFNAHYNEIYPDPIQREANAPKNGEGFSTAIIEHWNKYAGLQEREEWELLFTEVAFKLELSGGRFYRGRIDAIYHVPGRGIVLIDDKSTRWNNESAFQQWFLSFQVSGYLLAAKMHGESKNPAWKPDDVWGMIMDITTLCPPLKYNKDGSLSKRHKNVQYNEHGVPYRHKHNRLEARK